MPWRCADLEKLLVWEPGQAGVHLFQTRPGPRGALCWPGAHPHQLPSGRTPSTPEGYSRPPHSPFPPISQLRAWETSCSPPPPAPNTHSSAGSPLGVPSLHCRAPAWVCVYVGGGVVCLGCSEASSNHSPASQGSSVSWLLARAGGPGVGERGTPGPCSLGPRHTALLL